MASSPKNRSVSLPAVVPGMTSPTVPAATGNLAPAAAAKLGTESAGKTGAGASGTALPGWQSMGKDHKPTHSFGKQGRREKKVRW